MVGKKSDPSPESIARANRQRTAFEEGVKAMADVEREAAAKARYVLNLYAAELSPDDTRHRDLVAAIFEDFARLAQEG